MNVRHYMNIVESETAGGQCFPWAFAQYVAARAEGRAVTLVHARITPPESRPFWHAWIEDRGRAYDWQTMVAGLSRYAGEGWPLDAFYETYAPIDIQRFNGPVGDLRRKFGHTGPWRALINIVENRLKGFRIRTKWVGGGPYSDALWTNDGDGDWAFPGEMLRVTVEFEGKEVAGLVASYLDQAHGGHLAVFNVGVHPDFRRKGLARAMYDIVEKKFHDKVLPYPGNEGGAIQDFWRNRLKDDPETLNSYRDNIGSS